MGRSIFTLIVFLFCHVALAGPWFVYTNEQGRLQFTESAADRVYAVGAVVTSSVMPQIEPEPQPPRLIDEGIEVPVLVLQSLTNQLGVGVIASDDGTLLTYTDHQSPRPDAKEIKRRQMAAIEAHKAKRAAQSASTNAFGKGQVLDRIAAIEAWIKAQETK